MIDLTGLDDDSLVVLAAPLIDMLDALHGNCDYEADCDEPAPREWRIGAFIAGRMLEVSR